MASVVLTELNRLAKKDYLYSDLKLDLSLKFEKNAKLYSVDKTKDILMSTDLEAVKNSLYNLFNTLPGQKILNPIYGLNLLQFIFTGITPNNAKILGDTILQGILKFEPRVNVTNIYVVPQYDDNQYDIYLTLDVPSLNISNITLEGVLSKDGYNF